MNMKLNLTYKTLEQIQLELLDRKKRGDVISEDEVMNALVPLKLSDEEMENFISWLNDQNIEFALFELESYKPETTGSLNVSNKNKNKEKIREITAEEVSEIKRINQTIISTDTLIGEDDDSTIADFLADTTTISPEEYTYQQILKDKINSALGSLSEREREVILLRYGLDGGGIRTLKDIGEKFGVTRERVRQIESRAIENLQHSNSLRNLQDFVDKK